MTRHRPHPALRRAVDRVLVFLTKVVSRAWFRSMETQNLDRITNDRPILIAANHANGFVDPVIIMATSPRTPQFLAKSGLWKLAPVGFLLDAAGVLPVRRRSDGCRNVTRCPADAIVDAGSVPAGCRFVGRANAQPAAQS